MLVYLIWCSILFSTGSEKRVGNVYSKASSFVDYVRRALRKLDLDETKVITDCSHITFNVFSVCPHASELHHNETNEINRLKYVWHIGKYGYREQETIKNASAGPEDIRGLFCNLILGKMYKVI